MMDANVTISRESKLRMERLLAGSEKLYNRSVFRSLKTAVDKTYTLKREAVQKHYNLKASAINRRMKKIKPRSYNSLRASVVSKSKPINLINFSAGSRISQVQAGVKVEVKKNEGRKLIPRAFIQKGKGGTKRVFWRVRDNMPDRDVWPDKKKLKKQWGAMPGIQYPQGSKNMAENLRALSGPRTVDIFTDPMVMAELQRKSSDFLMDELKRQIELSLKEL